jgi:hypothetical protein
MRSPANIHCTMAELSIDVAATAAAAVWCCCSQEEQDAAVKFTFPMFSLPTKHTEFLAMLP